MSGGVPTIQSIDKHLEHNDVIERESWGSLGNGDPIGSKELMAQYAFLSNQAYFRLSTGGISAIVIMMDVDCLPMQPMNEWLAATLLQRGPGWTDILTMVFVLWTK